MPNDGHRLARLDREAHVLERRRILAFVGVGDVAEFDALLDGPAERNRLLRRPHERLEVQQLEQRLQVQLVLVHRLQAAEQGRECLRYTVGRLDVQRQTTNADRAAQRSVGDVQEGQAAGQHGKHRPHGARQIPTYDERSLLGVIALEEPREALDEEVTQREQFDLFVVDVSRHEVRQI